MQTFKPSKTFLQTQATLKMLYEAGEYEEILFSGKYSAVDYSLVRTLAYLHQNQLRNYFDMSYLALSLPIGVPSSDKYTNFYLFEEAEIDSGRKVTIAFDTDVMYGLRCNVYLLPKSGPIEVSEAAHRLGYSPRYILPADVLRIKLRDSGFMNEGCDICKLTIPVTDINVVESSINNNPDKSDETRYRVHKLDASLFAGHSEIDTLIETDDSRIDAGDADDEINASEIVCYYIPAFNTDGTLDDAALHEGLKFLHHDAALSVNNMRRVMIDYPCNIPSLDYPQHKTIVTRIVNILTEWLLEHPLLEAYFSVGSQLQLHTLRSAFSTYNPEKRYRIKESEKIAALKAALRKKISTRNDKYANIVERMAYIVNSDEPILLLGETGTGKEYVARTLHELSDRSRSKFEWLNCGELQPHNLHSEIFGVGDRAFTGVVESPGRIGAAEDGTLFIDEIGVATKELQDALIVFIEHGIYHRVGEPKIERKADVRIILGTNADMRELIRNKMFREDLYARIATNRYTLIPIRDRKEDIELLAREFIYSANNPKPRSRNHARCYTIQISPAAIEALTHYRWIYNVRGLRNYIYYLHNCAVLDDISVITIEYINDHPYDEEQVAVSRFDMLESLLSSMLHDWPADDNSRIVAFNKHPNNSILQNMIMPILSKIYRRDIGGAAKAATQYVGIDMGSGDASLLYKYDSVYELARKRFSEF